jgi:hypothetical protein
MGAGRRLQRARTGHLQLSEFSPHGRDHPLGPAMISWVALAVIGVVVAVALGTVTLAAVQYVIHVADEGSRAASHMTVRHRP